MQLRQGMSFREAIGRAVAARAHSPDLKPEDAAQLDAAVKTWALPRPQTYRVDPAPLRRAA